MNKNIRNIIIFTFVVFSCGWLGVLVDKMNRHEMGNTNIIAGNENSY